MLLNSVKMTITDTKASEGTSDSSEKGKIDDKPSDDHSTTTDNPMKGKHSSTDILDENGNVKTRRWFGPDGKAERGLDQNNTVDS